MTRDPLCASDLRTVYRYLSPIHCFSHHSNNVYHFRLSSFLCVVSSSQTFSLSLSAVQIRCLLLCFVYYLNSSLSLSFFFKPRRVKESMGGNIDKTYIIHFHERIWQRLHGTNRIFNLVGRPSMSATLAESYVMPGCHSGPNRADRPSEACANTNRLSVCVSATTPVNKHRSDMKRAS